MGKVHYHIYVCTLPPPLTCPFPEYLSLEVDSDHAVLIQVGLQAIADRTATTDLRWGLWFWLAKTSTWTETSILKTKRQSTSFKNIKIH